MGNQIAKVLVGMGKQAHATTKEVYIENEMLMDILSHLPVKDIVRFRCVCKLWRDVSSNPDFVNLHMSRAPSRILVTLETEKDDTPLPELLSHNLGSSIFYKYDVISSCNGLLVIHYDDFFFIINPATHRRLLLPQLASDSWVEMRLYHIPSTGKYKLVGANINRGDGTKLSVLNIGETWRQMSGSWLSFRLAEDAPHLIGYDGTIATFDVKSEQFIEHLAENLIAEANNDEEYFTPEIVAGWPGGLAVLFYGENITKAMILEDYKSEKWVKKVIAHQGSIDKGSNLLKEGRKYYQLTHDGFFWFQWKRCVLYSYHIETGEKEYFRFGGSILSMHTYMPTLAACDGMHD